MLGEVATSGAVTVLAGALPVDSRVRASQLDLRPAVFDPADPAKRPAGWFEVRRQRVLVKEQIDRLNGVEEETIFEMRPRREREAPPSTDSTVTHRCAGGRGDGPGGGHPQPGDERAL